MRYLTSEQIDLEVSVLEKTIFDTFERRYGFDYRSKYSAGLVVDIIYGIAFALIDEYYGKGTVHKAANSVINKLGIEIS